MSGKLFVRPVKEVLALSLADVHVLVVDAMAEMIKGSSRLKVISRTPSAAN